MDYADKAYGLADEADSNQAATVYAILALTEQVKRVADHLESIDETVCAVTDRSYGEVVVRQR